VKARSDVLAIMGGSPVRDRLLPYGRHTIDETDIAAVVDVLRSDWLTTGPAIGRFEEAFAAAAGAGRAVAVSNGTAALHLAMLAAGIGAGDEVITTPLTFAATANAVRYAGGTVVFADIQPHTLNIDPRAIRDLITPRTKAIAAVDFGGLPADLDELLEIAGEYKLTLIEDAAHALGATYRGRKIGGIATMTTFSLHPVKHVTAGEGGVVTTNDPAMADRVRMLRNHGITSDHLQRGREGTWFYEMVELGFNYRLTDMQCALAQSQLAKSGAWLDRRREIAAAYRQAWACRSDLVCPCELEDRQSAWHLYPVQLKLEKLRVGRGEVFKALRAENIGVNVHYIPVPWHPYYTGLGFRRGDSPVAEAAYERLLSLPMWPGMTDRDVSDVVRGLSKVLDAYAL
jgi:UDP-4-amino-4,6-dideoxy-N-acetyl-beta-L-altrosamine transaminase